MNNDQQDSSSQQPQVDNQSSATRPDVSSASEEPANLTSLPSSQSSLSVQQLSEVNNERALDEFGSSQSLDSSALHSTEPTQLATQPATQTQIDNSSPDTQSHEGVIQSEQNLFLKNEMSSNQLQSNNSVDAPDSVNPPPDYFKQAQSAINTATDINPRKTAIYGGAALLGVIAIGVIALLLIGPKTDDTNKDTAGLSSKQQPVADDVKSAESLTVNIPASWRIVEDKNIGIRVKLPEPDMYGTDGSSESETDGVKLSTSAYGVATAEGESPMSISLVRADGVKDEKQLNKLVQSASGPTSPASLIYKDITSSLVKKNVNEQTMYVHEFSGKYVSKKRSGQSFKSTTVYQFKEGVCYGVIGTTSPKNPDYKKELDYAYTVAASLEKL